MDEITQTQRKTTGYWFSDGIVELVGGVALMLVGASMWLSVVRNNDSLATIALFVMIIGFPLTRSVVRWVKDRITHARTGYVKFPDSSPRRRGLASAIALVLGVAIGLAAVSMRDQGFEGPLGTAITVVFVGVLAAAFVVQGYRMSMPRFYLSGLVVAVSAGWGLLQEMGLIGTMGLMWLALGLTSIVTGAVALASYLRANPRTGGEAA